MNTTKPAAGLSFDIDNKWAYLKTHGSPGWESFPSYMDIVVPRVLQFLEERNLTITFFVVGQDAALEKNHPALRAIAAAGHEIGNHSFRHEAWLHENREELVEAEIALAEEHIEKATGQKPVGFRGPGYDLSEPILHVLVRRGYLYDASTLPTYIGPLGRAYYFMTSRLNTAEKRQRSKLFGTLRDGLRPIRPYWWEVGTERLLELPVTTMPIFKVPVHASYILYLSRFSPTLALAYFKTAMFLFRLMGVRPSLLLHPLDFMGCDDTDELSFFPAMDLPRDKKMPVVSEVVRLLAESYNLLPLRQFADCAAQAIHSAPVDCRSAGLAITERKPLS